MLQRMMGAALLRVDTYEDVEHDKGATPQALLVVMVVAIAAGIGTILSGESNIIDGTAFGVVRGILSWVVWAMVALLVGGHMLRTEATEVDWGQLARGTGFAQTPGLFNILVFIPAVGGVIAILVFLWQTVAMIVAVRQSLDYTSTLRAFFVIVISLIPVAIINGLVFWALRL